MTKQLYEEALADVKKLKEVAEDNAKRALLEAVTPRIRDLIENQLLGEAGVDDDMLLLDDPEALVPPESVVGDPEDSAEFSMPVTDDEVVTLNLDDLKADDPESAIEVPQEYELSMESARKLDMLLGKNDSFGLAINKLGRKVNHITSSSKIVKESKGFNDVLTSTKQEVEGIYSKLQNAPLSTSKKSSYEELLESFYSTLNQLTEQKMKKRNSTLSEADVTLKLTDLPIPDDVDPDELEGIGVDLVMGGEGEGGDEGDDELDLDNEEESPDDEGGDDDLGDLDLGGDEEEDEEEKETEGKMESRRLRDDQVVEIDEGMLRREISRMKTLREADETKPQSWGHGAGDIGDLEDEDLGDPLVDIDLTTEGDDPVQDDDMTKESDLEEMEMEGDLPEYAEAHGEDAEHTKSGEQPDDQSNEPGKTVESIRRRLRAEARLQMEAKKKALAAKQQKKEAQQKGKQAQKKKQPMEAKKQDQKSKQLGEAYNFYARKFNESVARCARLKGLLSEAIRRGSVLNGASNKQTVAEAANLRAKLAETNLFNAKLLFTNKLLQNESLTKRQKAEVIERLDEARSEREVKLVYESLVKTLQGSTTRRMTESADRGVIGSSSRLARPASTAALNEGFEADRWARLAGIVK